MRREIEQPGKFMMSPQQRDSRFVRLAARASRRAATLGSVAIAFLLLTVAIGPFTQRTAAETTNTSSQQADGITPLEIGEQVPASVTFTDVRYLPRTLRELGEHKAYVLVFMSLDCPIAQRYLPRLKKFDETYRDQGVQFVAINVGPDDPIVEIANQAVEADIAFPFGKDFDGSLARRLGVTRTPEVVVLDADHKLRYRGRIDDQIRFSGPRPQVGREDLKEAIEDVLAGQDVEIPETTVDGCLITFDAPSKPTRKVTYYDDVAPILATHCQECHRPNTPAPFSLLTYDDADAHAEMIGEVVAQRRMPPWFASNKHGTFSNRRWLSHEELSLIADWVAGDRAAGTPPGAEQPRDKQPEHERASLEAPPDDSPWRIGKPDLVLTMQKPCKIPAEGVVPYQYAPLPHVFEQDTWVQGVEVLPGNRQVVHHANLLYVVSSFTDPDANLITGYIPGGGVMSFSGGVGYCIPKGARLYLQLHYVTAGHETEDTTRVGIVYAKEPIDKESKFILCRDRHLAIPPGDPHYCSQVEKTINEDVTVFGMVSHMHYRGKDMVFRAFYPDGREETLLSVPNYTFDWQLAYRCPPGVVKLPAGTRVQVVAHFDNSAFNPYNPDPTKTVHEGRQSFHEMMYGFVFYTEDDQHLGLQIDPNTGWVVSDNKNSDKETMNDKR